MMNKKGTLVLRDMVFMMMIVSIIFVLAGLFVDEMSTNYENTNMSSEWANTITPSLANSTFYSVGQDVTITSSELSTESTGILSLITGGLKGLGKGLFMVLTAPNTIGNLVGATLEDMNVPGPVPAIIKYFIVIVLWVVVMFTIYSAFLRGSKL